MDNNGTVRKTQAHQESLPVDAMDQSAGSLQSPSTDRTRWWDIAARLRDQVHQAPDSSHYPGRQVAYNAYKRWRYAKRAKKARKRKATKASQRKATKATKARKRKARKARRRTNRGGSRR